MSRRSRLLRLVAAHVAMVAFAMAQQEPAPSVPGLLLDHEHSFLEEVVRDDYREVRVFGGFRFRSPAYGLELRGENALLLLDLDETERAASRRSGSGLPRRGIELPEPRRRLSPAQIRERLDHTLRAIGRTDGLPASSRTDLALDVLRYVYCEGGIVVVRDGREVLRCDRLWLSPLEDRVVVENAELRYVTPGRSSNETLVVRGPRLVREGSRWTGRDVTMTTCNAGRPHAAAAAGEIEIIEREGEFEIRSRGQTLQIGGTDVLPLPDAHIFTKSQSEFPIRRASAGYSGREGAEAEIVLGLPWNNTGGRLHHWLTDRPAVEFRGEWELGLGWIERRGFPVDAALSYRAADLYEGRTEGFWIDDQGTDLREIRTWRDGSAIGTGQRALLRTQNRVRLGDSTHLDLVAFDATDPGVLSEYFAGDYRTQEVPESGLYLHHAAGNSLLTVGTRHNLADFSYRDDRALADRFVEESPVVTYQWLAQPIAHLPWGTPLIADLETGVGERRSDYDDRAGVRVGDSTLRADQLAELSAPFHLGPLNVRPYTNARGTWYDDTVAGGDDGRIAFEGGVQIGTRLQRTWSWIRDDGEQNVRHVIAPRLTWRNRFYVDDDPSTFFQFDPLDQLAEQQLLRFEVRNLLQTMGDVQGRPEPRDFVMFDLAQDVWPQADRDNQGERLGLLHYDLLLRPRVQWLPLETFSFAVYGDHDWKTGLRTLDTELQMGRIAGITWAADYRTDALVAGAVGVSAATELFDRWDLYARSQRDIENDAWLNYSFGLRRNDHDWSILAGVVYNPFSDETTFRIEFLPRFGGMNGGRRERFGGMDPMSPLATSF